MFGHSSHGSRHMLIMVLCCLIPIAALGAIFLLQVPVPQVLTFGLLLLCPLGHFLMMAFMPGHKHDNGQQAPATDAPGTAAGSQKANCH